MTRRSSLAALALVALVGCSSSEPSPKEPGPGASPLTRYARPEAARTDVEAMLSTLGVELEQRLALLREYDALVARPDVAKAIADRGISATLAQVGGSGGLVVGYRAGSGLACFSGGRQAVRYESSGWSVGATIGGAKTFVVGVVIDLKQEADFVGTYNVGLEAGAAGDITTRFATGRPGTGSHTVYLAGIGVGLSGDVSAGQVSVTWSDAK